MANTSVFLDTDVLINWLAREVDPNTGEELWKAPLKILKRIEAGGLNGFTSVINLMETIFVLRRKKKWENERIVLTIGRLREIPNFGVLIPTEADMIAAYSTQAACNLDPFDSIYYSMVRGRIDHIISRNIDFMAAVNDVEKRRVGLAPEAFLKEILKRD